MPVITFAKALEETATLKRHLLIGNGFSIALFPGRFTYGSLLDSLDFTAYPEAKAAFEALQTTDFELVIQALRQAVTLLPIYGADEAARDLMQRHAEALKELLVHAIAGKHPERPGDVTEEQYRACRRFLAHFRGKSRASTGGRDLRGCLFTVNYDLLLYWTLMHDQFRLSNPADPQDIIIEMAEEIEHRDGFLSPENEHDAEYVTWDGENMHNTGTQSVFFLHGALHLFDYGSQLQKICWERAGGDPLIDQIRRGLDKSRFPLFVSEGNSSGKLDRIRHSAYLHKGLRTLRANCNKDACIFVFGHSFADNDAHILDQIRKGTCRQLYVSLHGDPANDRNRQIVERANRLAALRDESSPRLNVQFFDATSANVWG